MRRGLNGERKMNGIRSGNLVRKGEYEKWKEEM